MSVRILIAAMQHEHLPPLIVLTGPTAVGKTALSRGASCLISGSSGNTVPIYAWQAAGSPPGANHPSADGAYIAAATLYSRK